MQRRKSLSAEFNEAPEALIRFCIRQEDAAIKLRSWRRGAT